MSESFFQFSFIVSLHRVLVFLGACVLGCLFDKALGGRSPGSNGCTARLWMIAAM
jgi:hypothetical protein